MTKDNTTHVECCISSPLLLSVRILMLLAQIGGHCYDHFTILKFENAAAHILFFKFNII